MKRGQDVYIIVNGKVINGVIVSREQKTQEILVRYNNGNLTRYYKRPIGQVATEIERGTSGVQGSSESGASKSNNGRNVKNGGICKPRISIKDGKGESNQVFVGAWRVRNMA